MPYEIIQIPQGINFIQDIPEFKRDLPDNIYLDKVTTGSGFTTAVLTNDVNYVVAVPFRALGENKLIQSSSYPYELFMYHAGIENVNLKLQEYLSRNTVKKIMVTYDSLPKLKSFIDFKDYKLAVDEGHKLLEYAGNFKPKVIHNIFRELPNFKSYIVATATPTREEFIPIELKDTRKVKLQWGDIKPTKFKQKRINQNQLFDYVVAIALGHYRGESKGNAYIYFNSVKDIVKIVKVLVSNFKLTPEDVKIICAINDKNINTISILGKGWKPKPVIEQPNKFYKVNFVTSTAFEGQDFLDPEGVTYIVSDGRLEHTKLDISTQVSQIVGRLRVSEYKDEINMLWTCSPIGNYRTEEEYQVYIDELKAEAQLKMNDFQTMTSTDLKYKVIDLLNNDIFFIDDTETEPNLILNPNAESHMMNNFIGTSLQYFVSTDDKGVIQEKVSYSLRDIFCGSVENNLIIPELSPADKKKFRSKVNFAEAVKEYFSCRRYIYQHEAGYILLSEERLKVLRDKILEFETDERYSVVISYIDVFGVDQDIQDLSYGTLSAKTLQDKITKHYELYLLKDKLHAKYSVGDVVPNEDLKAFIRSVKDIHDLRSTIKLTDVSVAFEYKLVNRKIDGKKVNAFQLLKKKS